MVGSQVFGVQKEKKRVVSLRKGFPTLKGKDEEEKEKKNGEGGSREERKNNSQGGANYQPCRLGLVFKNPSIGSFLRQGQPAYLRLDSKVRPSIHEAWLLRTREVPSYTI